MQEDYSTFAPPPTSSSLAHCPQCGTLLAVVREPLPLQAFDHALSAVLDHALHVTENAQAFKSAVEELVFARHSPPGPPRSEGD